MQENPGKMSLSQILFSFNGRIGRGTFWGVWFSMIVGSLVVGLLIGGISGTGQEGAGAAGVVSFFYLVPCVWITLAMQIKRWHDREKSGWMILINFIPIIGWLWAFIELGLLQGTIGPNQYGNDPLQKKGTKSEAEPGKKQPTHGSDAELDEDVAFIQAEPISRKRMELLWLDPPTLAQLEQPLSQAKVITVNMGSTSSGVQDYEVTQEDFVWARQIERFVNKGYLAGQHGNYKSAIQHYKTALKLAPGCDLFLMSIGSGYAQLGQKAKAVQYLERAAQISPGNSRIRENLDKARRM
jgi:uncharacterized membrane protein YhaH (DUF805 family)